MSKTLTPKGLQEAAKELGVELAAIRAVDEIESRGAGFTSDGKVKVLFERHKFHEFTKGKYDSSHPNLSSPKSGGYGPARIQYSRFSKAFELDPIAAMKAASWGRYQIMGFNYKHAGFKTINEFVDAIKVSEDEQLKAFVSVIKAWGLVPELRQHEWANFARQYNGKGYKKNRYDEKLAAAYEKFKNEPLVTDSVTEPKVEEPKPEEPKAEQPTQPGPAEPAQDIRAIPPLPVKVPDWAKKILKWGASLNLGGLGVSFATLQNNPEALMAVLNILKWGFIALGVVAGVVAIGAIVTGMWNAKLANDLNVARLQNYADPETDNIDFSGWKAAPDKTEVKL